MQCAVNTGMSRTHSTPMTSRETRSDAGWEGGDPVLADLDETSLTK